jgi:hypothetical protein
MALANGSTLPSIWAKTREGDDIDIAVLTAGTWSVVLLYRGHW